MMFSPPARCRACGSVFYSGFAADLGGCGSITLKGCKTNCPSCGGTADIIDGTFDFVGNAIRLQNPSSELIAVLTALQSALRAAQNGDIEATEAALREAPSNVAEAAILLIQRYGLRPFTFMLMFLLTSCSTEATLDVNKIVDQFHVYITGAQPYPFETKDTNDATKTHIDAPKNDAPTGSISRQQQRQLNRQSQKRQNSSGQHHDKKS